MRRPPIELPPMIKELKGYDAAVSFAEHRFILFLQACKGKTSDEIIAAIAAARNCTSDVAKAYYEKFKPIIDAE